MNIKLRTKNGQRFGQTVSLVAIGKVEISDEGIIEVPTEDIAKEIERVHDDFFIIDGEKEKEFDDLEENLKKKAEQNEFSQGKENEPLSPEEKDELSKSLEGQSLEELRLLAKPFPKKDWKSMDQSQLIEYLKNKLN